MSARAWLLFEPRQSGGIGSGVADQFDRDASDDGAVWVAK